MRAKIFLCGVVGLFGISTLFISVKTFNTNSLIASSLTTPKNLPPNLETTVRQKMAQQLLINPEFLKLTESQIATWEDCLPDKSGLIPAQPCAAKSLSGWRVTMSSPSENWVYYVTNNGFITLDATASLNNKIITNLSKILGIKPKQLKIIAAQLTTGFPVCAINGACKIRTNLGWRILVEGREQPFFLSFEGTELKYSNLSLYLPPQTAGMPRNIAEQVLEDVVHRHDRITANLKVDSIKPLKSNSCDHADLKKASTVNCKNIEETGWQMTVISGVKRYIYYIPQSAITQPNFYPLPDGIQSLSHSLLKSIKKDAAKRANLPEKMINLRWGKPIFFDRCLHIDNEKLNCRQSITAGWKVEVMGVNLSDSNISASHPTWIYHVNLLGNDIRFLQSGVWTPVY
jgi:hypothetical protein